MGWNGWREHKLYFKQSPNIVPLGVWAEVGGGEKGAPPAVATGSEVFPHRESS